MAKLKKRDECSELIAGLIADAAEYDLHAKFFLTTSDDAGPEYARLTGDAATDNAIILSRRNKIARLLMPKLYAATRAGDAKAARKFTKHMGAYNEAYSLVLKRPESRAVYARLVEFRAEYARLEEYATTHDSASLLRLLRAANAIYRDFMRLEFPYRMLREAKQAATLVYKLGNPRKDIVFLVDASARLTAADLETVRDALRNVVESGAVLTWDRYSLMSYSDDVTVYQSMHRAGKDAARIDETFAGLRNPGGGAAFCDGVCAALDALEMSSRWNVKWLFCVVAGADDRSTLTLEHVLQQLSQPTLFVFVVIIALDVPSDHLAGFAKICDAARERPNGKGILLCAQPSNLRKICGKAAQYVGERAVTLRKVGKPPQDGGGA
jgi:hypothetical protein